MYQFTTKQNKWPKIHQMVVKRANVQKIYVTSSIAKPSKIYTNCDFWSENIPSGNPAPLLLNFFAPRVSVIIHKR
jgi:hypothetical protein